MCWVSAGATNVACGGCMCVCVCGWFCGSVLAALKRGSKGSHGLRGHVSGTACSLYGSEFDICVAYLSPAKAVPPKAILLLFL